MSISSSDLYRLMKKLLLVLAVVSVTTGVAEYLLRKNLNNEETMHLFKYRDIFRDDRDYDIFILGNSQSVYGIIPSYITLPGMSVHNYSFSGACPAFNYELYANYLRKYRKKPKLIIYSVSWFMFDPSRDWRKIAYDHHYIPLSVDTFRISPYERLYLSHQSDVLNKIFRDIRKNKHDSSILIEHYDNGFVPLEGKYHGGRTIKRKFANSAYQVDQFRKLIRRVQDDGGKILFIEPPEYLPGIECESRTPNEDFIRAIAKSNGIRYVNYNEERRSALNFEDEYFGDWTHLNHAGAKRFSRMLSEEIHLLMNDGKLSLN